MPASPLGEYRVVGKRSVPEDHIYPVNTPEERAYYYDLLWASKRRMVALHPFARVMAPGEPRVKRFLTLEAANEDALQGMLQTLEYLSRKSGERARKLPQQLSPSKTHGPEDLEID